MPELLITSGFDRIQRLDSIQEEPRPHVTIWQYFKIDSDLMDDFTAEVSEVVNGFSPLEVIGAKLDNFGENNDVMVRRVDALGEAATILTLHSVLGSVISSHNGVVKNPEWSYEGYNPHVTLFNGVGIEEGERRVLSSVEIIEKQESGAKVMRDFWRLEEV